MMAPALAVLLLLVAFLLGGAPPAAAYPEPVAYPRTRHTPPSIGRLPFLSHRELEELLAKDTPLVDPTGAVPPEEIPPPTPVTCGRRLPGTAHTVRCDAAPPLGGIVLAPPRRATASLVLLHGYSDLSEVRDYLDLLQVLLTSAPEAWSSVRLVFPVAPRVLVPLVDVPIPNQVTFAWFDPSPSLSTTLSDIDLLVLGNMTDVGAVERRLLTATEDVDRLGLFFSTRRVEAIIAAEHRVLKRGRRGGRCRPAGRVVLAGHSLGAVMATHVALHSRARLDALVALQGFVADARRLDRVPGVVDAGDRGYPVEFVSGERDAAVPPALVAASAAIVRRLLRGAARVTYATLPRVTHSSFFLPGPDADAVARVLTRHLR